MTVATGNFAELLWPGLLGLFGDAYKRYEPLYTKVFDVRKSEHTFEKIQGVTGTPLASVKNQGGSVNYVDPNQGYQREFVNTTYGIGATVTKEMWSDDQYDYINGLPGMLVRSLLQTKETIAFTHMNNFFSTDSAPSLTADGIAVLNASHPLVGGGVFSNVLAVAADLAQTSLETLTQQLLDAVDDQGLKIRLMPKALIVPTALNYTSRKLMETPNVVGSADNDINPMNGQFKDIVVSPWLTDNDRWFIKTDADNGAIWLNRWADEPERDNEFDTKNLKFTLTWRGSSGVVDPRAFYGTPGA